MMKITTARNLLVSLLAFLGLGAMGGGGLLIISPSGKLMGMPLSMLSHSPFSSFLLPAILLFFVVGIVPLLLIYALIKIPGSKWAQRFNIFSDMHWAWSFTIYTAFALITWIQLEMVFLQAVHWLHTFYMLYAMAIILVALLPQLRGQYKTAKTIWKKIIIINAIPLFLLPNNYSQLLSCICSFTQNKSKGMM